MEAEDQGRASEISLNKAEKDLLPANISQNIIILD